MCMYIHVCIGHVYMTGTALASTFIYNIFKKFTLWYRNRNKNIFIFQGAIQLIIQ